MENLAVYKFGVEMWYTSLYGIFICDKSYIKFLEENPIIINIESSKHVDEDCRLDKSCFTLVSDNLKDVEKIKELGLRWGYNPLEFDYKDTIVQEFIDFSLNERNEINNKLNNGNKKSN